ncbi:transposase [Nocardiopsis sp. LOL_012]|uniref:transposase n=1 Tax=Nocardiopsis sp. LOL_012 TaxID=3345409 RepID=UPI003A882268
MGHFAVLWDGTRIDNPRFLRRAGKELKKAQRDLSRKRKGSANRAKARHRVARAHARVADCRREFHTICPHGSSARTKRCTWRTCVCRGSGAPGRPRACTTPDGRRS